MRNLKRQISIIFLLTFVFSQQEIYRSVDDIESEWTGYASFQKEEMISFCDFLFREGHYERCLLSSFQLLYKFSEDPIIPVVNYYIARCYEEMESYDLAQKYYQKVISQKDENTVVFKASKYRHHYVNLLSNKLDQLLEETKNIYDPYLMTFRGYAFMKKLNWEQARTSFVAAQSLFNHTHYDELMTPLYQAIENVNTVPTRNKYLVLISSALFPGGGQFLLDEWGLGQGILSSVSLMALIGAWTGVEQLVGGNRVIDNESIAIPLYKDMKSNHQLKKKDKMPAEVSFSYSSIKYWMPPFFIGAGIYVASSLKSFKDTDGKNKKLIEYYITDKVSNISSNRFLDFPEPQLVSKK